MPPVLGCLALSILVAQPVLRKRRNRMFLKQNTMPSFVAQEHLKREWEILVTDVETGLPIGRVVRAWQHGNFYRISLSYSDGMPVLRTRAEVDYIVNIYNLKNICQSAHLTQMKTGDTRLRAADVIFKKISDEEHQSKGWLVENWQPSFEYPNLHVDLSFNYNTVIINEGVENLQHKKECLNG